ncbi:MAG: hypothetical protein RR232_01050 [Clostridia bacterium]
MIMLLAVDLGGFFNTIWSSIKSALISVVNLLPGSPFQAISNAPVSEFLGSLNWIFPVSEVIAELQLWTVCIGLFYVYMAILRWVKAIE